MNSLSLRVSSIKNSDNLKKNSEIRVALLVLPPKYAEKISNEFNCEVVDFDLSKFKEDFAGATSIDQQLVTVRKCFTSISPSISTDELTQILHLLTDLFFFAPLKHPVRNAISKLLQKAQVLHGLVVKCLANTIEEQTNQLTSIPDHLQSRNNVIISLGGYFENFPIALTAIKMCVTSIFKFIADTLANYLHELRQSLSPAKRSEVYIFTHSAIRLSLAVVQQCFEQTSVETIESYIRKISEFCYELIDNVEVPMDTKVNCGQFLMLLARLTDTTDQVFESILSDSYETKGTQKLIMSVGVINTFCVTYLDGQGYQVLQTVCSNLTNIASQNAIEQSVLIAASRGLVQLSKNLLLLKLVFPVGQSEQMQLNNVVDMSLSFVWTFAEHYMDSVRHLSRDLLRNLLKLTAKYPIEFEFLTAKAMEVARDSSQTTETTQCLAMDHLCQILGARVIIQAIPNLNDLLMKHITEPNWTSCYEKLMTSSSKDLSLVEWYTQWVQPTLRHLSHGVSADASLSTYENLISSAINVRSEVVDLIIAEKNDLPLEAYLFVVWTMRKNSLPMSIEWTPALDLLVCDAKVHGTDEVRIMPLRILIEVGKSTEVFGPEELSEVLAFLYYNCNCQSPAMRSMIASYMTKAFLRLEASHAAASRIEGSLTPDIYMKFLLKLRNLCISNLFDGSNFSRRSISLSLLLQTVKLGLKFRTQIDAEIWNEDLYEVIFSTVENDTYESNKAMAIEIVKHCPINLIHIYHQKLPNSCFSKLEETIRMALISVRPGVSLAAAYLIDYLIISRYFKDTLEAIEWCEQILISGLSTARRSLLTAARTNPMYGLVFCIKRLLSTVDFKTVKNEDWRPFVSRFIGTCKDLLQVVGPIVNSDSPEGHLPNDCGEIDDKECKSNCKAPPNKVLSSKEPLDASTKLRTTPQMVLLCAWRTVKEVSLLLGELTLVAPITYPRNPQNGIITVENILDIGARFQVMLTEIKHRGAFEQAYVGFSKLCVRLWRSSEAALHNCPMKWLVSLIEMISGQDAVCDEQPIKYERICATRRSAGVPFMIQALITSELQVCSSTGLQYCMQQLFALCRSDENEESRTHALNILRALFRCTDLGDVVSEFISDGLECSINGYTAKSWPERNSATLLFAALITRIFGVQRTRHADTLNIRNKMTGRIFFLRYPRLFDFISMQLRLATDAIAVQERPLNLHPLLLLLSRLYPSSLEGCESSLQLASFLPHIMQCSVCPEMETRKLAVKSMFALVAPNKVDCHINDVLCLMKESSGNSNSIHGCLLQIHILVRSKYTQITNLEGIFNKLLSFDLLDPLKTNHVIGRVYIDILFQILIKLPTSHNVQYPEILNKHLEHILNDRSTFPPNFIGRPESTRSAVVFKLLLEIRYTNDSLLSNYFERFVFNGALSQQSDEHIETILNVCFLLLSDDSECSLSAELPDEYEFTDGELNVVNYLTDPQKSSICQKLKSEQHFKLELFRMTSNNRFYPVISMKLLTALGRLGVSRSQAEDIYQLLKMCENQPDNYQNCVIQLIGAHLQVFRDETDWNDELVSSVLLCLRDAANPDSLDNLRISAAACAYELPATWLSKPTQDHINLLDYSDLILALLRDDHYLVREHSTRRVMQLAQLNLSEKDQPFPISSRAEEIFLDWLDTQVISSDMQAKFWQTLFERQLDLEVDSTDVMEVFKKNEANLFGERLHTARLVYHKLMSCTLEANQIPVPLNFRTELLFFTEDCVM